MFSASVVKNRILAAFGLVVSVFFFFSYIAFLLPTTLDHTSSWHFCFQNVYGYGLFSQFPLARTPAHPPVFYRTLSFVLIWNQYPPVKYLPVFPPSLSWMNMSLLTSHNTCPKAHSPPFDIIHSSIVFGPSVIPAFSFSFLLPLWYCAFVRLVLTQGPSS